MQMTRKIAGFLIFLSIFLAACSNSEAELARFRDQAQTGVERAEEVKIVYSDSARVRTVIEAPLMWQHLNPEKPKREFPEGLEVQFFNAEQQPSGRLKAKYGEYLPIERKVRLLDSVRVWNTEGESLETEELIWSDLDSSLTSTKFVRITTPKEVISGYGLLANTDFSQWQLGRVSGVVQRPQGGED